MNQKKVIKAILLWVTIGACGCQMTDVVFKKGTAVAEVDVPYKGDVAAIKCFASNDQHCFNGIGHLRNRDWQKAIDELTKAVDKDGKDTKDHKAHFALGVAYEMQDNLEKALEHYKAANFTHGDPDYIRALDRAETKMKQNIGKQGDP